MFYQKSAATIIQELNTDPARGLTTREVNHRLAQYGYNLLPVKPKTPLIFKFFQQFKNILVIILLGASVISLIVGDLLDTLAIFMIVLLNATIGFMQELSAEKTLDSLKKQDILYALVIRDSQTAKIPFENLVPGDILVLEEGEKVPTDARIIESFSLRVDESILTGESLPASKNSKPISGKVSLADQKNLIFKDTQIVAGRGKAVVLATGKNTEIGKIATYLESSTSEKTPLTYELEKVGHVLTVVIIIIAALVFMLNIRLEQNLVESLLISISLAVAAIPEGLPAIVTIVLSLGVKRLASNKTIVKKLPAVETLGAVRIIATDKTGTLTQNKMNVVNIITGNNTYQIEGSGYEPVGTFLSGEKTIDPLKISELEQILKAGILASNASYRKNEGKILGDTTEGALLVASVRAKMDIDETKKAYPRVFEVPFTSERKMMSVVVKVENTSMHLLFCKGAPEVILEKCHLNTIEKKEILAQISKLATKGYRSLAFAKKRLNEKEVKDALEKEILEENNFEFMGLMALADPIRMEVKEAISQARLAGIRTIMVTGDHKQTAIAIAREAGIIASDKNIDLVLTDDDVSKMTKHELAGVIKKGVNVFARISPMGKLKIIESVKSIPNTYVAVTGDGVNDAPALKASHIGIAMGQTGTDITREVADMVITDDNYATIVVAIREGRIIYANLVKFIRYLISCNLSEVIVVAGSVLMGMPVALLPIQILWINLITDGFPALALGVDPPEFDVMSKPPRNLSEGILHKKRWFYMFVEGSIMGMTTLFLYSFALTNLNYGHAQTMAFATLAFSQLTHAFNNRSTRKSLFKIGIFGNKYLIVAAVFSIFLQTMITQSVWGNSIFKTIRLDPGDWMWVGVASLIPFAAVELKKQLRFRILP